MLGKSKLFLDSGETLLSFVVLISRANVALTVVLADPSSHPTSCVCRRFFSSFANYALVGRIISTRVVLISMAVNRFLVMA